MPTDYKKFAKKYARKEYNYAKTKVFGRKGFTGRYGIGKGKGGLNFMQIAKDLQKVKERLNVEKHYKDTDVLTHFVAQVNANADGALLADVTPQINQGNGFDNRKGNSVKMTGLSIPMSFHGQNNTHSERKIVVSLLKVKSADNGVSITEAFQHYWDINPLNGFRDTNAPRNYRNSKHDGISCIREKTYRLKPPGFDLSGSLTEGAHFSAKFNVKLDDVLRYDANTDNLPTGIKYYLIIRCDAGNHSTGTTSTADVPVTAVQSGVTTRISSRAWYVDN